MPLVSVVMPVFNGETYLAEAIESILSQTFTDFELLIVDDGSHDSSAEIIREYEKRDGRIRFFQLERNMGSAFSRNVGIDAASGEYIAGMDCDDVSPPERLQKQLDFMESNPEIGVLGTCALVVDHVMNPIFDYRVPEKHAHIALNMFLGWCVVGASVMMRRNLLIAWGGYDPSSHGAADLELVSRSIWRTRYANLPENLYLYRQHQGQQHSTLKSRQLWSELMRCLLIRLWGEAPQATLDRLSRVRKREKIGWAERRRARRDYKRLVESMIAANWVEPHERPPLVTLMNRRLEQTTPRLWQMFCHWRRHNFGR